MNITAYWLAERYVGMREVPGTGNDPQILAMLNLDHKWPKNDETPWCSAFANWIAWQLRLPRSKSLLARSWLTVGTPIELTEARQGFDVVVLSRGKDAKAGHVGFFAARQPGKVFVLGGNQGDSVSVAEFQVTRVIGVRRLWSA